MKKFIFFTFVAFSMSSISAGCVGLSKKSDMAQEDHLVLVYQKIMEIDKALSSLNLSTQNLEKRVEELAKHSDAIDTNYSNLNTTIDALSSKIARVETRDSSFETTLSETQKNINDLSRKLTEMERLNDDLQNKAIASQPLQPQVMSPEPEVPLQQEVKEEDAGEITEEKPETITETREETKTGEVSNGQEKELLQKLLDEALISYREGNYSDAIAKWEEVIAIDPESIEAKFNIEIAKEKLKSASEK